MEALSPTAGARTVRILRLAIALIALALIAQVLAPGVARAEEEPPPDDIFVEVPMELDCGSMDPDATEYALANDLCAVDESGELEATAAGVRVCGTGYFQISNLGGGRAIAYYSFVSSSTAIYRSVSGNFGLGLNNVVISDSGPMFGTTWAGSREGYTGIGLVSGRITISLLTVWGSWCSGSGSAVATVT